MKPILYCRQEELDTVIAAKKPEADGTAFSFDESTVFHAYLTVPFVRPQGIETKCKFLVAKQESDIAELKASFYKDDNAEQVLVIITQDGTVCKAYVERDGEVTGCEVIYVPEKSELFSRSKGLLEVATLEKKKVGIVGLGSGGSLIAIELAKAGIGGFVLIDFDRLELANVARHWCGVNDLGRLKTIAMRDAILEKNPYAEITTVEIDITEEPQRCSEALATVDLIIAASDNDRSRFQLNELALKYDTPAIFGRALTRAAGGDILRVRPKNGPCYNCLYSQNIRQTSDNKAGTDEELKSVKQVKKMLPDYTSDEEIEAIIQVGLSSDIAPISNMMVKLALVELSKGLESGIKSLEEDLVADFYIWANRREATYEGWEPMEYNFNKPTILRWYGAKVERDPKCMVCGL